MVHVAVAEAAVVGRPHKLKGECLYCFITLKSNREFSQTLVAELKKLGKTGKTEVGNVLFSQINVDKFAKFEIFFLPVTCEEAE